MMNEMSNLHLKLELFEVFAEALKFFSFLREVESPVFHLLVAVEVCHFEQSVGKSRYRFVILLLAFQHLLQEPLVVFQCEITFLLDVDEAEDLADWIRMELGVLLEILVKRLSEIETIDRPIFQLIACFEDLLEFFDVPEMTGSYPTELREAHGEVKLILASSFSIFVKEKCVEDIFR